MPPLYPNDPDPNVNALIVAVNSIEQELGLDPNGVYASVRTRLDILEARINNPFAPAPNVNNPFYIGGSPISGVSIQAGVGNPEMTLPPGVPGSIFLRQDGYAIQGLYAFRPDGYWHQIPTDPFTAAGDLSGTNYTQTVIGLQGRPINSAAPAGGNSLGWNGIFWEPVSINLAGGTNSVFGQLPPANMGLITLNGDVTGSATGGTVTTTVSKINGTSVSASPTINQVLVATSSSTSIWQLLNDNQISASAGIQGTKINPSFGSQNIVTTGNANVANLVASGSISGASAALTGVASANSVSATTTISGNSITSTTSVSGATLAASGAITGASVTSGSYLWSTTPNFGAHAAVVFPTDASYVVPSAQYKSHMLLVTSSVALSTTHNLTLPLVDGSAWMVQNNTSGGASIKVVGNPVGLGVTIANGAGALVWTDGTNFYSA